MSAPMHCSFCGRSHEEVDELAAGPGVYICDACVEAARRVMGDAPPALPVRLWRRAAALAARFAGRRVRRDAAPQAA